MVSQLALATDPPQFGRAPTSDEVRTWDIDVGPDGQGLPSGSGSVLRGKEVYMQNCAACHGPAGEGGIGPRLEGGEGTLATANPVKTIGSYWPYAPTLFDYIRRAMPYTVPGSLSTDDTYAVTAYLFSINGIVPADATLDERSLPAVKMPNRNGFLPDRVFELYDEKP
jgi:cytochrome c